MQKGWCKSRGDQHVWKGGWHIDKCDWCRRGGKLKVKTNVLASKVQLNIKAASICVFSFGICFSQIELCSSKMNAFSNVMATMLFMAFACY